MLNGRLSGIISWVLDGNDVPMCLEVFSQDRVVRFANLAMLKRSQVRDHRMRRVEMAHTMNFKSLAKLKRSTASIRSSGSAESLILYDGRHQRVFARR